MIEHYTDLDFIAFQTFSANTERHELKINILERPISARFVRIQPRGHYGGTCLRLELYGCKRTSAGNAGE